MSSSKLRYVFNKVIERNKITEPVKSRNRDVNRKAQISRVRLSVVGCGSTLSAPCLHLNVSRMNNRATYLFNLNNIRGTNTLSLSQLRALFFTGLNWQNQAHGAGMLMSNSIFKTPHSKDTVHVHGPPGLTEHIKHLYSFLFSKKVYNNFLKCTALSESSQETYEDENICVKKIFFEPESIDSNAQSKNSSHCHASVAYICHIRQDSLQKVFDFDTLGFEYDIWIKDHQLFKTSEEKRRFFNNLTQGVPTLHPKTGETIYPDKLLKKANPVTFMILECPTSRHFTALKNSDISNYSTSSVEEIPCVVVHITPESVLLSASYKEWMEKFGDSCSHLVLNEMNNTTYNTTDYLVQSTLCSVSKDFFPSLNQAMLQSNDGEGEYICGYENLDYVISPSKHCWVDEKAYEVQYESMDEEISSMLSPADDVIKKTQRELIVDSSPSRSDFYPRLVVLGCGSSNESKYRAQPGFLLFMDEKNSILIDCGNKTLLRIYQQFGQNADDVLASIKVVFLSHKHYDHHSGFLSLMREVVRVRNSKSSDDHSKIFCLMTNQMVRFYSEYCMDFSSDLHKSMTFLSLKDAHRMQFSELNKLSFLCDALGVQSITPVPVTHAVETYGLSLVTACGKKVVYSSDTMPMNRNLIREGKDADLLIHDCLFLDEEWEMDATLRNHTYLKGALATSTAMNAKFMLLTHFASFFPALPITEFPEQYADKVACAMDFLQVSLSQVHELPKIRPALAAIFSDNLIRFQPRYENMKVKQSIRNQRIQALTHAL